MDELGHGTHSNVYLARHKKLNVLRAIKYINKSEADSNRYLHEANLIKNLKHPGIPIIYDIEDDDNSICIIEEYIAGKSLTNYMQEHHNLPISLIIDYAIQICEILHYLHSFTLKKDNIKGILHLDLKPDNIMIIDTHIIKIIDYDNAFCENADSNHFIGSKGFAAPEQYHRLNLGQTADIYSLGVLLLYMSTCGYVLSNVEKIHHKELKQIIQKCIRHNPVQRYDDINKVKLDLLKIKNKKSKENTNQSLEINVYGIKHGIGATHICLSLTNYLNSMNIKTLCMDCSKNNDLHKLVQNNYISNNGTYQLYKSYLLPNYNSCVDVNLKDFKIIVKDMGVICNESINIHNNKTILIVSGGKPYEQAQLNYVMNSLINSDKCAFILNHVSGRQFYDYIKNNKPKFKSYRMPCQYEWFSEQNVTYEAFFNLISDLFPYLLNIRNHKYAFIRRCINNIRKKKEN